MTSLTAVDPDETVTAAAARQELVTALHAAADFYDTHEDAPLPAHVVISIRVPGVSWAARRAALDRIARALCVRVVRRNGVRYAERDYGRVVIEAHLSPQGESHSECTARMRAAHAAPAVKALAS